MEPKVQGAEVKLSRIVPADPPSHEPSDILSAAAEPAGQQTGCPGPGPDQSSAAKSQPQPRGLAEAVQLPARESWVPKEVLLMHLATPETRWRPGVLVPLAILGLAALALQLILRAQLGPVYGLRRAAREHLSLAQLEASLTLSPSLGSSVSFEGAAWEWLEQLGKLGALAPGASLVGGLQVSRRQGPWAGWTGTWVLCKNYSAWSFLGDSALGFAGRPEELRAPSICSNRSAETTWLPSSLASDSTLASEELAAARSSWGTLADSWQLRLALLAHSPESALFLLVQVALSLDASGLPLQHTSLATFQAEPAWFQLSRGLGGGSWVVPLLDLCLILALLLVPFFGLRARSRPQLGAGSGRSAGGLEAWDVLHLALLLVCLAMVVLHTYAGSLSISLQDHVDRLPSLSSRHSSRAELEQALGSLDWTWHSYTQQLDVALDLAQRAADAHFQQLCCTSVFAACACLRLCRLVYACFRLQSLLPATGIAEELACPAAVCGLCWLALSLAGMMVYGSRVDEFKDIGQALSTTLLLLVGWTVDDVYMKMHQVGGVLNVLWVWLLGTALLLTLVSLSIIVVVGWYLRLFLLPGRSPSLLQDLRTCLAPRRQRLEELEALATASTVAASGAASGHCKWPEDLDRISRRRALQAATRKFSRQLVLERLSESTTHPASLITPASLASALGAETWAEELQLEHLLLGALALAGSSQCQSTARTTLDDALRLMVRVDANVQDLSRDLTAAVGCSGSSSSQGPGRSGQLRLQKAKDEADHGQGKEEAPASFKALAGEVEGLQQGPPVPAEDESLAPSGTDDFDSEDLPAPPPPLQEAEGGNEEPDQWGGGARVAGLRPGPLVSAQPPRASLGQGARAALASSPPPVMAEEQLEALGLETELRCTAIAERCASLEVSIAEAAEQTETIAGAQVEVLSKLEKTFDQLLSGVGSLFPAS